MNFFKNNKGFTLIEILVVIAIMGIMVTVLLFNYKGYGEVTETANIATQISQTVREAQVNSSSVKVYPPNASGVYTASYGAYIEPTNPGKVTFFADCDNDGYDTSGTPCPGSSSEKILLSTYKNGYKIKNMCGNTTANATSCSAPNNITNPLTVLFKQATLVPIITSGGVTYSYVEVKVYSPTDTVTKTVKIYSSGQTDII
jgi:prepilin-type N-terminal cleavage/methylation domain-containing protein